MEKAAAVHTPHAHIYLACMRISLACACATFIFSIKINSVHAQSQNQTFKVFEKEVALVIWGGERRQDTSFWWSRINHVFGDVLQEDVLQEDVLQEE